MKLSRMLLLLIVAVFFWWDYTLLKSWWVLQREKNRFQQMAIEYEQLSQRLKSISGEENFHTESVLEELAFIKSKLYAAARVRFSNAEYLSFLSQAANALGLTDIRPEIKQEKKLPKAAFEKLSIKLRLRARYHEVARFLNMLERSPYLIRIRGFSIVRGKKDPTGPTYATILLVVYRLIS